MKNVDEKRLWEDVLKLLPNLPFALEVPLSFLEQALWPQANER